MIFIRASNIDNKNKDIENNNYNINNNSKT